MSNAFAASSDMIMFYFFSFIHIVDYIDRFSYVELSLHLWNEANLIMVDAFFYVFLGSICPYFIEYFYINVHEADWSVILFLD